MGPALRYVSPDRVQSVMPSDWFVTAKAVGAQLAAASDAATRRTIISRNSPLWREAGRYLLDLMGGKCWYCETREERSDRPVDHYRPKARVAGEDHEGYWWLAFVLENFRVACTYCNSKRRDVSGGSAGGKADHFPLAPNGVRAVAPTDALDAENPLLLDPTSSADVNLLLFDETGVPSLNDAASRSADDALRVEQSIQLYHWRHRPVATGRRLAFKNVSVLCAQGDAALREFEATGDPRADSEHHRMVRALNVMIDRESEHSAAALCALRGLRTASATARAALEIP